MSEEENADGVALEVYNIPDDVHDDLLVLYFENKRRSSGGRLTSLQRHGNSAILIYENPEDAKRVLSKGEHVLQGVTMQVRKAPPKDPGKVVLRGLNPDTARDILELYVEFLSGADCGQYSVFYSSTRETALIQFQQPLTQEEFKQMVIKSERRPLEGVPIHVEHVRVTDSIVVENLLSATNLDLLLLYFESKRSNGGTVRDVKMLPGGKAIVAFAEFEAADRVLKKPHQLEGRDLLVHPYYDFLEPSTVAVEAVKCEEMDTEGAEVPPCTVTIHDTVKMKLLQTSSLLKELQESYPQLLIQPSESRIKICGPNLLQNEQAKNKILEFLSNVTQSHIPFDTDTLTFLQRVDVQQYVENVFVQKRLAVSCSVSDYVLTLNALSLDAVREASSLLKGMLCRFSFTISDDQLYILNSSEWKELMSSLKFCATAISQADGQLHVIMLKDFRVENEKRLLDFLQTNTPRESVITMEAGMLCFLQEYYHDVLADLGQVSVLPLEGKDVTGFKISGDAASCQAAEEFLRSIIESIHSKSLILDYPGVARFLLDERGREILKEIQTTFQCVIMLEKAQWTPLDTEVSLDEFDNQNSLNFERKLCRKNENIFQSVQPSCDVNANQVNLPDIEQIKDIIAVIHENNKKESDENSETSNLNSIGISGRSEGLVLGETADNQELDSDEENLYTAPDGGGASEVIVIDDDEDDVEKRCSNEVKSQKENSDASKREEASIELGDEESLLKYAKKLSLQSLSERDMDEEAQMYLAIQCSMDFKHQYLNEEEDLQKILELSRKTAEEDLEKKLSSVCQRSALEMTESDFQTAMEVSIQDTIQACNSVRLTIYVASQLDGDRIACHLEKEVHSKLHEEKIENECLQDLSECYRSYIDHLQRKHAVRISVEDCIVTVCGFMEYTIYAIGDVTKLINRILQGEKLKVEEADISKKIQWVYYDHKDQPVAYPVKGNVAVERAWRKKQKSIDVIFDNKPFTIDFERMEEYNIGTAQSVKIERRPAKAFENATSGS
ncbi:protein mono-ADP-ribosyltransferase PARP10 [Protopterus annectens]|uniref:protein mono-ADP-ribosyltransferase PARP10 n=1 Tax=Protopterus annectens TaxID=7888 RepID=UPI001CF95217|nr:protein mono-ADP-ribosyltransferase PARP10 [Protopterus annectens]